MLNVYGGVKISAGLGVTVKWMADPGGDGMHK